MPITDLQIKNSKPKDKAYFLYDAEKIYIEIAPSGSKLWRTKYRFNGKERRTALFRKPEPNDLAVMDFVEGRSVNVSPILRDTGTISKLK